MKAKEKAKELVERFLNEIPISFDMKSTAKRYALICVEEKIDWLKKLSQSGKWDLIGYPITHEIQIQKEVKQEINNI